MPRSRQNLHNGCSSSWCLRIRAQRGELYHASHFVGRPRTPMVQTIICRLKHQGPVATAPALSAAHHHVVAAALGISGYDEPGVKFRHDRRQIEGARLVAHRLWRPLDCHHYTATLSRRSPSAIVSRPANCCRKRVARLLLASGAACAAPQSAACRRAGHPRMAAHNQVQACDRAGDRNRLGRFRRLP